MKILLFWDNRLDTFFLPTDVQGMYNFDYDDTKDNKLINIKEDGGKWVLYQTPDVSIVGNNSSLELIPYSFYQIKRGDKEYAIYTVPLLEAMDVYMFQDGFHMVIGTEKECNVKYNTNGFIRFMLSIFIRDGNIVVDNANNVPMYVNQLRVMEPQYSLHLGDEVNVFGLRIMFANNLIYISKNSLVSVDEQGAGIQKFVFPKDKDPMNIEINDEDLYKSSDYFSKTPRFRRIIETKEVRLSPPPGGGESQEMPLILTIGPMLTMGIMSIVTLSNTFMRIGSGEATFASSWTSIVSSCAMLASMFIWPLIIRKYNKRMTEKRKKEIKEKYTKYINDKFQELSIEAREQREIIYENLVPIETCINYIHTKKVGLWDKRNDQNDFLVVRIGMGKAPLSIHIGYQEEDFKIDENELRDMADKLSNQFKYIEDTPISYSFAENVTTAIMGIKDKVIPFTNNIILQLMTFYTYEDLKFVVFTKKENEDRWSYLKYLNHTFTNEKDFRFFATDSESAKQVGDYLLQVINMRMHSEKNRSKGYPRPYFFVITDNFDMIKQHEFVDVLTEADDNVGCSLVILEDRLSKLPSKCNNFITLGQTTSGVLRNSYENQERLEFVDEIQYHINYLELAKELANIPIEFEESMGEIPDSISYLEMEHVGKIEQLNISNRWHSNDSTNSLRAEVGVDEHGSLMYLDLHEKFHGPHGLIAGTTGSGKSEFIITYILSMCINYSPDDVSFILIDYKGGGLALAFENRRAGISLPHLAGTITNLDKAEMDRTLVSIDSEVKRRQALFNDARDELGESTMDIYKYQRFYHEGRLKEPISHLLIICDEFAELKSQQPDFMDNLISVARIGRSLGVHLILATQKPSGVVNDQIWSNTRFRVCLKVQNEADSKEMLKRPEAAHIKQAGRFYLQVGYDEYFALGQSGYSGAKYYPSDKIIKEVDKSINFIDDCGNYIKSIKASGGKKIAPQGEQLLNVLHAIIDTAKQEGKFAKRLWLENIPEVILEEEVRNKYQIQTVPYQVQAVIGEYDAPENQKQGVVVLNYLEDGNTIIYGNDSSENEHLLRTLIYSTSKYHTSEEVNYYIVDFGSESLRSFHGLPHIGGMVFQGEEEKFHNLLKLLKNEIQKRKKLFAEYGGEYQNYLKSSQKKLPLMVIIFNNFDSIYENYNTLYDVLPEMVRDSERYGIVYIFTANAVNSVFSKLKTNFDNYYAFKLKDSSDYTTVFNTRTKIVPRDMFGRGLMMKDSVHEFQTVSIIEDRDAVNDFVLEFVNQVKQTNQVGAKGIPVLPNHVTLEYIKNDIHNLTSVPIGISKKELDTICYDFVTDTGTIISSLKLENTKNFVLSFIHVISNIPNTMLVVFDVTKYLGISLATPNYYTENIDGVLEQLKGYIQKLIDEKSSVEGLILICGLSKFISKLENTKLFEEFLTILKKYEHMGVVIIDDVNKLKQYSYEQWYSKNFISSSGIWIGRGAGDQSIIRISTVSREMSSNYKNDMGYVILDNMATLVKYIDFYSKDGDEDE